MLSYLYAVCVVLTIYSCFFFNDTATTEIYTLSLHERSSDLPVNNLIKWEENHREHYTALIPFLGIFEPDVSVAIAHMKSAGRSEEHTSELQSRQYLVCRLLLEKKKKHTIVYVYSCKHECRSR